MSLFFWGLRETSDGYGFGGPILIRLFSLNFHISAFRKENDDILTIRLKPIFLFICFLLILFMSCHAYMTFVCHHGHLHLPPESIQICVVDDLSCLVIGSLCSFVIGIFCNMSVIYYSCNKKNLTWLCTEPV